MTHLCLAVTKLKLVATITNCFPNNAGVELGHGLTGQWTRPFESRSFRERLLMHGYLLLVSFLPLVGEVHNCRLYAAVGTYPPPTFPSPFSPLRVVYLSPTSLHFGWRHTLGEQVGEVVPGVVERRLEGRTHGG